MNDDPELRKFLAGIYELIRTQQNSLFDLIVRTRSLEMVLNTNPSAASLLRDAEKQAKTDELVKAHELSLAGIGKLIQQIRGDDPIAN